MSKSKKFTLNTLALILGNVLFWLCNYYPKHILEISFDQSIVSTIINFIYFVLFDFFLIIVFSKNKAPFAKNLFDKKESIVKRFELIKLCALILVQLAVDGIVWLIGEVATDWSYVIFDAVIVLQWFIIYIIVADKSVVVLGKHRVCALLCIGLAVVLLGISVVIDRSWVADTTVFSLKYEAESPALLSIQTNLRFVWEVKALVLDTLIGLILIWVHLYAIKSEEPEEDRDILRGRYIAAFIIRCVFLVVLCTILKTFKFTVWQNASLQNENIHTRRIGLETWDFYNESTDYEVMRMGEDGMENVYYEKHFYYIFWNQHTQQTSYKSIIHWPYDYFADNGQLRNGYTKEEFQVSGVEKAYLLFNQFICYYNNGVPCVVKLNELNTFGKNDTVTAVCKQLLSDGNIFAFEYVCNYLLANDPLFIQPYIERYAEGHFTEMEKEWMEKNFYKSEYVVNIAKSFV